MPNAVRKKRQTLKTETKWSDYFRSGSVTVTYSSVQTRRENPVALPESPFSHDPPLGAKLRWVERQDADFRENPHGEDHNPRG